MASLSLLKRTVVVVLITILFKGAVFCNVNNTVYSTFIDSITYRLKFEDITNGELIQYNFPPIERGEEYTLDNIKAVKYQTNRDSDDKLLGCSFRPDNPIEIYKHNKIKIKYFSKNIDSLSVKIKLDSIDVAIELSNLKLSSELLYYSFDLDFIDLYKRLDIIDSSNVKLKVNEINIYTEYNEECELIINDLVVYIPVRISGHSESSLINAVIKSFPITYQNQNQFSKNGNVVPKVINLFQKSDVEYLKYPIRKEYLNQSNKQSVTLSESKQLKEVSESIRTMLLEYFENTESDKKYLLKDYDEITHKSKTLDAFYTSLEKFLYKLNDSHVKLINEITGPTTSTILPIYFYNLQGTIQVVTVLDTTLLGTVNLGDKLLKINNLPIFDIIKSLDKRTTGSTPHSREMKILQKLLFYVCAIENDELLLELDGIENGVYTLTLTPEQINNNSCIKIPQNILEKQKRLDFKRIENVGYLKVGIFNEKLLRPFLYSYLDSIQSCEGLVIDFRNCPGGDLSCLFLFSFFIDNPNVFFTYPNIKGDHETVMVNPDPYYGFTKPVVILVDGRTTCSAEFFTDAMIYSRGNVISIGASKTAGSAQATRYFDLPDTENFRGGLQYRNSINYSASGKIIDETGGIRPTVLTSLESYLDLAPYNDQILQMAKSYLDKTIAETRTDKQDRDFLPLVFILITVALLVSWLTIFLKIKGIVKLNNLTIRK